MLYPAVSELVKKTGNRYSLVIVTAKRARQIVEEMEETGEVYDDKPVKLAVAELAAGKILVIQNKDTENIF